MDDWKTKVHQAGVMLNKMREAYAKELTLLRAQVYKQQRAEESGNRYMPPEIDTFSFKIDDFLLSNEVAKCISDSQLTACKEKMVSMQVECTRHQNLLQHMMQKQGDANVLDMHCDFSDTDKVNVVKAEQAIDFELARFKSEAERQFKCKLKQCAPAAPGTKPEVNRQRRQSAPSLLQMSMRRKSSTVPVLTDPDEAESSGSSDEDEDDIKGLKARFEAKLKNKDKIVVATVVNKAKDRFLNMLQQRKPKGNDRKEVCDRGTQSSYTGADVSTQFDKSDAEQTFRPRTYDQGANTERTCVQDRGVNPIPQDAFACGAILDEADMTLDVQPSEPLDAIHVFAKNRRTELRRRFMSQPSTETVSKMEPTPRNIQGQGTNLPPCVGSRSSTASRLALSTGLSVDTSSKSAASTDVTWMSDKDSSLSPLLPTLDTFDSFSSSYASPMDGHREALASRPSSAGRVCKEKISEQPSRQISGSSDDIPDKPSRIVSCPAPTTLPAHTFGKEMALPPTSPKTPTSPLTAKTKRRNSTSKAKFATSS